MYLVKFINEGSIEDERELPTFEAACDLAGEWAEEARDEYLSGRPVPRVTLDEVIHVAEFFCKP